MLPARTIFLLALLSGSVVSGVPGWASPHQSPTFELRPVPAVQAPQNGGRMRLLDFHEYVRGASPERLRFSLRLPPRAPYRGHSGARLVLNRHLEVEPTAQWFGSETLTLEVSDGRSVDYQTFELEIVSSEAGTLVEAEDAARIERVGGWVGGYHDGADYLYANRPGTRLRIPFVGTQLALRVFVGSLHQMQRYFEGEDSSGRYHFVADWKTYPPGIAALRVDEEPPVEIALSHGTPGWTELLVARDLPPGEHEAVFEVVSGHVAIDRIRAGTALFPLTIGVADPQGTGLADVVVEFSRNGQPPIRLRTDRAGGHGPTYAVPEGTYTVTATADSNPGYLRPFDPDECLEPWSGSFEVGPESPRHLSIVLPYTLDACRSLGPLRAPVAGAPAIVAPGDPLNVAWDGPASSHSVQASLVNERSTRVLVPLRGDPISDRPGLPAEHDLSFAIPEDTPPGLYDLHVLSDGTADRASRAVSVIPAVPRTLRVVQLSDTHIRSTRSNRDHAEMLVRLAGEIEALGPLFVVITGDLTDAGSRPEYLRLLRALEAFTVPTFLNPGNHDHYSWWTTYRYRGSDEFDKYIGPRFQSVEVGDHTFILVDTGDYEPVHAMSRPGEHADQLSWLRSTLGAASRRARAPASDGLVTVLAHYDHTAALPPEVAISGQLERLLGEAGVDLYLHGHRHRVMERELPGGVVALGAGAALQGHYRVIDIGGSPEIESWSLQAGAVAVQHEGDNDGLSSHGRATVRNDSEHDLKDLTVRFHLAAGVDYEVDRGRIAGSTLSDAGDVIELVVHVDVAAGDSAVVTASPQAQ